MNTNNHGFAAGINVPLNFTPPAQPILSFAEQKIAADAAMHAVEAEKTRKNAERRNLIKTAIEGYGGSEKAGATLRAGLIAAGAWLTPDQAANIASLRAAHVATLALGDHMDDPSGEVKAMIATKAAEALLLLQLAVTAADTAARRTWMYLTDYSQANPGMEAETKAAFRMAGPAGQDIIDAIDNASRI